VLAIFNERGSIYPPNFTAAIYFKRKEKLGAIYLLMFFIPT